MLGSIALYNPIWHEKNITQFQITYSCHMRRLGGDIARCWDTTPPRRTIWETTSDLLINSCQIMNDNRQLTKTVETFKYVYVTLHSHNHRRPPRQQQRRPTPTTLTLSLPLARCPPPRPHSSRMRTGFGSSDLHLFHGKKKVMVVI